MSPACGARPTGGALLVLLLLLSACSGTPQTRELLLAEPPPLPRQVELEDVPFFPQEAYQCGPAALATSLGAAGLDITPDDLVPEVYLPGRRGSLQIELRAAARQHGFLAYEMTPRLQNLLQEVAAGTPVLVLQNLGLGWHPVWHYAVVVGYDLERQTLTLRSGTERRQVMSLRTFERTWARGEHWALLVLPPGRLPASAERERFIEAAVALESTGPLPQAQAAYATGLRRWPDALPLLIGLGNSAYALGDLDLAEQAFRKTTEIHPDSAAAFNNLAYTLLRLQRAADALAPAREAVRLDADSPHYRRTLRDVEAALPRNGLWF